MHEFDPHLMGTVLGYVTERLALTEPPIDGLGDRDAMRAVLAGLIGDGPRDPREVLDVYIDHLADTIMSADSPRFLAFIPAAPAEAALLFDMVVSAASLQGCSWLEAAGAVMAENQALETLSGIAGMPAGAGGVFVSGGSAGNLSAFVVARDTARHRRGEPDTRFQVIVSDQTHSSIANTLNICWMEPIIITATNGRLTREDTTRQLEGRDLSRVAAIVGTAGTTNAGIIDDLAACADLAAEHGWWFHVDGAYGGAGMLDDRVRSRYRGIERADSLVMDPHKWWFAPFDSAALIYREPRLARAVHTQEASYLDVIHVDDTDFNPSDSPSISPGVPAAWRCGSPWR
jgi:glutamate/tyrosine decarboxylase-like PLP-dependent enzyme